MRGWAILLPMLLLPGCLGDAPTATPTADVASDVRPVLQPGNASVDVPPVHPVGRAWTFRGIQEYNPDTEIVVVVAEARADGYLMAGATEDDVHYDALWGNPLMGETTRAMQREGFRAWLDFPLVDGKSWTWGETMNVTARRAPVATPAGSEDGFVISGENEQLRVRWEYAPTLGQLVSLSTVRADGRVLDDLKLVKIEEGRAWTWYERGEIAAAWNPHEPTVFEVPSGYDAVLVSAGGRDGARTVVQSPAGEAWSADFPDDEVWKHATMPAAAGRWSASVVARPFLDDAPPVDVDYPIGWSHTQIAPVKWIRSG